MSRVDDLINRIRNRPAAMKITVAGTDATLTNLAATLADKENLLDDAVIELERLQGALAKVATRWPCDTVETMQRLARETLGP
jgi:hypothetical protein